MQLTIKDVQKVARLARLKLSKDEEQQFCEQLGNILDYVESLADVDTDGVEPMAHTADVSNVFRDDEVTPSIDRKHALANAPNSDGKYFLVPQIIEGG